MSASLNQGYALFESGNADEKVASALPAETWKHVQVVLEKAEKTLAQQHETVLSLLVGNTQVKAEVEPDPVQSGMTKPRTGADTSIALSVRASLTFKDKGYQVARIWNAGSRRYASVNFKSTCKQVANRTNTRLSGIRQAIGSSKKMILHPNGSARGTWDALCMAMVTYEMIMIPLSFFEPQRTTFLKALEWIARIFWSIDIWMSFSSGYIAVDGVIEMRPHTIARAYIRSWFFIDGTIVGIDWLELFLTTGLSLAETGRFSRALRLLRMSRLVRLGKASGIISRYVEKVATDQVMLVFDMLKPFFLMIFTGHLIACIWYAIGKEGPNGDNWLAFYDMAGMSLGYRYTISVRWSLSQFSGGMDEFVPQNFTEHVFAAAAWLCAWWLGTAIISILTSQLTHLYTLAKLQSQQLNALTKYLKQHVISKTLCVRVIRNAQYTMWLQRQKASESVVGIAELVSPALLKDLHFEMYHTMLDAHRFFRLLTLDSLHVVRTICHTAMRQPAGLPPGDTIFQNEDRAKDMIFVRAGSVSYTTNDGRLTEELVTGKWISEAVLWTHWRHLGNLTAKEGARCVHLEAEAFQTILNDFELCEFDPVDYAEAFVAALNALPERSDLPFEFEWDFEEAAVMEQSLKPGFTHAALRTGVTFGVMRQWSRSASNLNGVRASSSAWIACLCPCIKRRSQKEHAKETSPKVCVVMPGPSATNEDLLIPVGGDDQDVADSSSPEPADAMVPSTSGPGSPEQLPGLVDEL